MSMKALQTMGLLLVGFLGATWGLSAYSDNLLVGSAIERQILADAGTTNACMSDAQTDEDDIFFLSCGGIF